MCDTSCDRWAFFRKRVIADGTGDPYLIRWTLLQTPRFSIKLHKILRSDADRALHDHPWSFWSLMLWGHYVEVLCRNPGDFMPVEQRETRFAPSLAFRRATDAHRLILTPGRPAWTLVLCGRRFREWGFWTERGWVPWQQYVNEQHGAA